MRHLLASILVAAAFVAGGAAAADLPTRSITIGKDKLVVEVVDTPDLRATGLMNRFSLQTDHGMLFVFDRPQPLAFWMKNTYIPLSIAFVDANGVVLNVDDMQPQDESTHWSRGPALYAIEVKRGWFASKGIAAGAKVAGLPPPARE
jgi:uncharacterized membrane protein (UPF0127 family)